MLNVEHVTRDDRKLTGILQALQDDLITVDEAKAKLCDLHNVSVSSLQRKIESRRKQITDINQWTEILLAYRHKIRERPLWSMIADISNRTTD